MIIEFFGLPGVGKTTISSHVVEKLKNKGWIVKNGTIDRFSFKKRVFFKLLFAFLSLIKEFHYSILLLREGIKIHASINDFINILYLNFQYHRANNDSNEKKIWVFDQGLLQAYWSICFYCGKSHYLFFLLSQKFNSVVIVEAQLEIVKKRLEMRIDKKSRMQKTGISDKKIHAGKLLQDQIINLLEYTKQKNILYRSIKINSELCSDILAEKILTNLEL